ncbi:MAG: hypothetical protein A2231_07355 [Candidatus Firestonebacteria bacterium RIFOXYA2_FULL_40_8]|nr:MAG: hypothetical protein A2231_07355 [Candidatus Firestonebacteria bacterium RIFOXYA2_FULL_40_8]
MRKEMKILLIAVFGLLQMGVQSGCENETNPARIGAIETCASAAEWYELDDAGKKVPPRVKMETKEGLLYVHLNRGLLGTKQSWIPEGVIKGSILRKSYGEVDLDKFHYLVVNIKEKGSGVFFGVNGFDTKAGYKTGITAVDLKDYDANSIHGKRNVVFEMDLHDNLTTLVVAEIKLVSELNEIEKKGFIDRGLTIKNENLKAEENHGLEALGKHVQLTEYDGEETAFFRDTATGAICARLTAAPGNDFFGEGDIWSADGAAIAFSSKRKIKGVPVFMFKKGAVIAAETEGRLCRFSPVEPTKLYYLSAKNKNIKVGVWDSVTGESENVVEFSTPDMGGYTEFKFTKTGKIFVGFRESPYVFLVDVKEKTVKNIVLSTRQKDAGMSPDEKYIFWHNCYTYEGRWRNLETGEEGLNSSHSVGHGCGGKNGNVMSFGEFMKIFISNTNPDPKRSGENVSMWSNWQNNVQTDYGTLTDDNEYIFTNGTNGDVANQHVMIPSKDTGAVMRIVRYFTKFSWESTTYSRPSPDYTKIVYNSNPFGSCDLYMAYTRRTDSPENVKFTDNTLSWETPVRSREIAGYNVYKSKESGKNYIKINENLIKGNKFEIKDLKAFYTVTAVENSSLESMFSNEVAPDDSPVTRYFEAERMDLKPPIRSCFDGYNNDFQSVRVTPETPAEKTIAGSITVNLKNLPNGKYKLWLLAKGNGDWTANGYTVSCKNDEWQWVKLNKELELKSVESLTLTSRDENLMLDTIMLTSGSDIPTGKDPRDSTAPEAVKGFKAVPARSAVALSWEANKEPDLNHYSIYCSTKEDFECDNSTLIRSVYKTSITDESLDPGTMYHYKIIAKDSRWNAGKPAGISVRTLKDK